MLLLVTVSGPAFAQHNHDHGTAPAVSSQDQQFIDELKGKNGKQAMSLANQWRLKNIDVVSFVTPDAVHFKFKNGQEVIVPLPDDQMIVSIAPYIQNTHRCSTHYISKCDAELKNVAVKVKAVTSGGKVLINQTFKSATGFIDLWLPRDQEINLTVSAMGKKAQGKILTYRDSKTCDTTLKLE
jgi:hypothetical protein